MPPKQRFECFESLSTGNECQLAIPHAHLPKEDINRYVGQVANLVVSPDCIMLAERIIRSLSGFVVDQ